MNEDTSSVNSEGKKESPELKVLKIFESRWNKVKYLANDLQKSIIEEYLREAENLVVSLSGLVASGREKRRDQKLFKDIISNTELQLGVLETNSVNGTKPIAKIEPIVPVTPDPIPTPEPKPVVIPPDLDPIVTPPAINNTNLNTPEPVFVVEPDPVTIPNIPTSLKQEVNEATSPAPVDIVEQLEKEYGRMQYIAKSLRHPRIKKIEQKLKELRVKAKEGVLDGELEGFKHSASILSRWINTLDRLYYIDEENENVQALIINRDRDQFLLRFGDATQMWVPISKVNDDNWPKEVRPPKVERVPKFDTSSLLEGQLNSMVASGNVRETIEEDLNPDSDTEFYALEKNIQMEEIWDKDTDDNLEPDEDLDTADLDESQLYAMMGTVEPVSDKDTVKVEDNFDTSALAQSQLDTMIANESAKTGDDLSGSLPIQKPRKPKRNKPTRKLAEDDINKNSNLNMKESVPKTITPNPEAVPDNIVGVENATPENTEGGDPVTNPENTGEVIDVVPDSVINKGEVKTGNQENIGQKEEDNRPQQNSDSKIIIPSFVGGRGPKVTGGADVTDLRNKILQMSPKNQDHIESKEKIGSQITEIKKQLDNLNSAEQKTTYRSKDFGQKFTEPVSFETGEAKKWLDDKNEELLQKLHNLEAEVKSFEKNKRKNEIKALLYELNKAVSQTSYHSKEFSEMFGVELPYETGQAKAWIENKVAELEAELDKLENNPPKNPESPKGPLPDDPLPERSVALETPISPEQPDLVPEESGQINPNGPSPINPDLDNAMETINSDYSGTFGNEEESKTVDSALENQEEVEAKQKFSSASTSAQERRKMRDQAEIAHKKYLKEYQIYEEGMTNSSQLKRFGRGFKKFFGRETMPPELLKLREESDRLSALAAGASDEALAKRSAREAKRVFGRITDNVDGKEQLTEVQWQEKFAYNNKNQKTLESFRKKFFESRLKEELETRMRALPPEKQSAVANIMKQLGRHKWFMRALVVGGATLSGGALGAGAASIKMIASLGGAAAARGVGEFYSNRANKQLEEKRKDFKLGEDIRSSMSSLRSQLSLNERQQLRADAIKVAGTIGAGALAGSYADEIPDSVLDTARGYVPQPISDLFDQVENGSGNDLPPNDPGSSGSPSDPAGINNEDSTAVSATESVEASDTNEEADNQVEAEPVLHTVVSGDTLWEIMENKFAGKLSELSLEDQEKVLAKLVGDGGVVRDWDPESIKSYGFVSGDIDKIRIGQELDLTALGDRMQEIIDSKEYLESQPAEVLPETPEATVTEPTTVSEENVIQDEVQQMPSLERLVELGKVMEPELLADAMKDPYFESNVSNIGAENFVKQFNYFVENAGGEISGDTTLNHEASTLAFKELQNFTVADADYQLDRLQNEVVAEGGALTDYLSSEGVSVTSYLNLLEKVQYLLEEGGYLDENSKPFPASANQNVGELVLKEFASLVSHGSPFPSNLQVPPVREINV